MFCELRAPEDINCSTNERRTLKMRMQSRQRRCIWDAYIGWLDTHETMIAASIVSRKTMKKMGTENKFFAILMVPFSV